MRHLPCLAFTVVLALTGTGIFPPIAAAEDATGTEEAASDKGEKNGVFDSLPRDVQDQIRAEAGEVKLECSQEPVFSYFHDCACMATKFVDERKADPTESRLALMYKMRFECVNEPGIVEYNHKYCMGHFVHMSPRARGFPDEKMEEYCRYFSKTVASNYARKPNPHYTYITDIQAEAMSSCRKQM